jgi:hypothetical protein
MDTIVHLIKLAAVLMAAMLLGRWFLAEVKSARARRKPWYTPYLSLPGLMILLIALVLPLILWYLRRG